MSALPGLFGRQRLDRQGVYLATHEFAERAVHELVARQALLALELTCHHARGKMGVVLRLHAHRSSGEACADQPRDVFRVHGVGYYIAGSPATHTRKTPPRDGAAGGRPHGWTLTRR